MYNIFSVDLQSFLALKCWVFVYLFYSELHRGVFAYLLYSKLHWVNTPKDEEVLDNAPKTL